ncbi:MAG: dihydrofolate reductase family protein [Patescibacteria group bacterium]
MKVVLIAAISVDGKIAESSEQLSLDWTSKEDTKFFVQKTKECGIVIMGRKTFDTIGKPLKDRQVIVMTRNPDGLEAIPPLFKGGLGGVTYTNESAHDLVERLQSDGHNQIALAGGATIYSLFLKEELVTDLFLTVEPVVFGGGVSLAEGFGRKDLELVSFERLGESQSILIHYRIR